MPNFRNGAGPQIPVQQRLRPHAAKLRAGSTPHQPAQRCEQHLGAIVRSDCRGLIGGQISWRHRKAGKINELKSWHGGAAWATRLAG